MLYRNFFEMLYDNVYCHREEHKGLQKPENIRQSYNKFINYLLLRVAEHEVCRDITLEKLKNEYPEAYENVVHKCERDFSEIFEDIETRMVERRELLRSNKPLDYGYSSEPQDVLTDEEYERELKGSI